MSAVRVETMAAGGRPGPAGGGEAGTAGSGEPGTAAALANAVDQAAGAGGAAPAGWVDSDSAGSADRYPASPADRDPASRANRSLPPPTAPPWARYPVRRLNRAVLVAAAFVLLLTLLVAVFVAAPPPPRPAGGAVPLRLAGGTPGFLRQAPAALARAGMTAAAGAHAATEASEASPGGPRPDAGAAGEPRPPGEARDAAAAVAAAAAENERLLRLLEAPPGSPGSGARSFDGGGAALAREAGGAGWSAPAPAGDRDERRAAFKRALRSPVSTAHGTSSGGAAAAGNPWAGWPVQVDGAEPAAAPAGPALLLGGAGGAFAPGGAGSDGAGGVGGGAGARAWRAEGGTGEGAELLPLAAAGGRGRRWQALANTAAAEPGALAVRYRPAPRPGTVAAGTLIPALLLTAVNSDLPGPLLAQVSRDVYDGQQLAVVVPRGTRLLGRYEDQVAAGQRRLLVAWTRLLFPDGSSVEVPGLPATDAAGAAGLPAETDNHLRRVFGDAVLLSLLGAGAQLSQPPASGFAQPPTSQQVAAGALGQELANIGLQLVRRDLAVQPTLHLPAATPFDVFVTGDLPLGAARRALPGEAP